MCYDNLTLPKRTHPPPFSSRSSRSSIIKVLHFVRKVSLKLKRLINKCSIKVCEMCLFYIVVSTKVDFKFPTCLFAFLSASPLSIILSKLLLHTSVKHVVTRLEHKRNQKIPLGLDIRAVYELYK